MNPNTYTHASPATMMTQGRSVQIPYNIAAANMHQIAATNRNALDAKKHSIGAAGGHVGQNTRE
ncbi:MAG: hypothetical protein A2664_04610 [Candidatus Taylorbacteria bacterium RIFCSPHIGHO2_01_FULL_46_22b]|uniref:Uncharacterized protein n=1 Tax=Candidatus Taylorbacteria bacterium RIFCSPHIGHO2_01_FULL_46_22b TaxID=1802301 RepID=A0A1G2M4D4_9BACT|nr:MAG: hypothetical protein A2664_04610 [Candidatus Taylorbacteria bacterium RIFCSPHIGHO2_01_FULL_46_22b]